MNFQKLQINIRMMNIINIKQWIIYVSLLSVFDIPIHSFNVTRFMERVIDHILSVVFPIKCFEVGCFSTGPPFFDIHYRPISVLPQDNKDSIYLLYTRTRPYQPYNMSLDYDSINESSFDARFPTKVLIPGFNVVFKATTEIFRMKDELLKKINCNVIIVDWTNASHFPYQQAVANGRKVGASIAMLLEILKKKKGLKYEDVHLIGHSLGAHVAGWVGKRIDRIGRITGLDPAGPYFYHSPPEVRLDNKDALFVDVIHTNAATNIFAGFGLLEPIGDIDFYPNGGTYQPDCQRSKSLNFISVHICEHSIASKYFVASIRTCEFRSVLCKNYKSFLDGQCIYNNSIVDEMGFNAKSLPYLEGESKFYLNITEKYPYCNTNSSSVL